MTWTVFEIPYNALRGHDEGEEYRKYKKIDLVNHFVLLMTWTVFEIPYTMLFADT